VCELIESNTQPPGIFSLCDDVVKTMHAVGDGADNQLIQSFRKTHSSHAHFSGAANGFIVKHYAGDVAYDVNGFCEKNRDVLFQDLIDLMKSSAK
jgi:myosin-1